MDKDEPIVVGGVTDALNYVRRNGETEVVMQLLNRTPHNGTLSSECHSLINQFERPPSSQIISDTPTNTISDASTSQTTY